MALKSLNTLIRLHKRQTDLLRREMQLLETQHEALLRLAEQLRREYEQERELAAQDARMAGFFGAFATHMRDRQDKVAAETRRLALAMEEKAEAIRIEFGEQKKYEIVREQTMKKAVEKQNRREQAMLDEVAVRQFMTPKESTV